MNNARRILGLIERRVGIAKSTIIHNASSTRRIITPKRMSTTSSIPTSLFLDNHKLLLLIPLAVMTIYEHPTFCHGGEDDEESSRSGDKQEKGYNEEEEKDACPFCRFFLESPCSESFQVWHKCINVSL